MKRNIVIAVLGVTSLVVLSGFWGGKPSPERIKKHIDLRVDDELDDLKATPDQRQKIHAQVDQLYPEATKLFEDHKQVRAEAVQLLEQDKVDANRMHALVDQRIDGFRAFAHKAVDAVIAVHDTLTPTQRAEVVQKARDRQ